MRPRTIFTLLFSMLLAGCARKGSDSNKSLSSYTPTAEARRSDHAYAYLDAARADLSKGKVRIINKVMNLSPDEAQKFWPLYHDYEEELFALGDQRLELTRRFVKAV